jgi:hypothetical protein
MCDAETVTMEHVPPDCLFPTPDDLGGRDLKKNLIKVPSCVEHNNRKSDDDTYLWYVLTMCEYANEIGRAQSQSRTRFARSIEKNPSLLNRILKGAKPVTVRDQSGEFETLELTAETDRLNPQIDKLARGLYFHHFKTKWTKRVQIDLQFLHWKDDKDQQVVIPVLQESRAAAEQLFSREKVHGQNPDVFNYRVYSGLANEITAMSLVFYGDAKVTVVFGEPMTVTLSEKMILLSLRPKTPGGLNPWIYKDCAVLFSHPKKLRAWHQVMGDKIPKDIGHCILSSYEETRAALQVIQSNGGSLLTIDPSSEVAQCFSIEKAIAVLGKIIVGEIKSEYLSQGELPS